MSQKWKFVITYRRPGTNLEREWVGTGTTLEIAVEECKARFLERNLRELPERNIMRVKMQECD